MDRRRRFFCKKGDDLRRNREKFYVPGPLSDAAGERGQSIDAAESKHHTVIRSPEKPEEIEKKHGRQSGKKVIVV
jgi:hypothetical protein